MSVAQSNPIRFEFNDDQLIIWDIPENERISGQKYQKDLSLGNDSYGYSNCTFRDIYTKGSISLKHCTAKTVHAAGNVLLLNSSVESVKTNGEVTALNCRNLKKLKASTAFTDNANGVHVSGKIHVFLPPQDPNKKFAHVYLNCLFENIYEGREYACVILDGATCLGDVIFPEDSKIPENERTVILRNGGRLGGQVIRGRLVNENGPQNSAESPSQEDLPPRYVDPPPYREDVAERRPM